MAREERRRYDEFDDNIDLILRKKKTGRKTMLVLVIGGIAVVLLACLVSMGIAVVYMAGSQPDEFIGSWKGRWTIAGVSFDSVYTFNKDGSLREDTFDLQGRRINIAGGRWQFRNGRIEITWHNGGFEHATVTHLDAKTMNYRVVNHSQQIQIGIITTFRRL